jgi:hypothetical protein
VTFPVLVRLTGSAATYFYLASVINVVAMLCWWRIRPEKS